MKTDEVMEAETIYGQVEVGIPPESTETGPVDPEAHRVFAGFLAHRLNDHVSEGYAELADEDLAMSETDLPATMDVWPD